MSDERIKRLERHVDWLDAMVVGLVIAVLLLFVMVTYLSEPPIIERPQTTITTEEK